VHLSRQVNHENIPRFHKTYLEVCKDPYTFILGLDTINDLLRFGTRIFPGKVRNCLHLYNVINRLKSLITFVHVLKDGKPQTRCALLESSEDDLIKDLSELKIRLTENKVNNTEKWKLSKFKNGLRHW